MMVGLGRVLTTLGTRKATEGAEGHGPLGLSCHYSTVN